MKCVSVDKQKLYKALAEKGHSPIDLAADMGHFRNYIYGMLTQYGGLAEGVVRFVQKFYGIPYEDYKPAEEEPKPKADAGAEEIVAALKTALDSYAWRETIARTVRFVLREEATEDMLKKIISEAIDEKLG